MRFKGWAPAYYTQDRGTPKLDTIDYSPESIVVSEARTSRQRAAFMAAWNTASQSVGALVLGRGLPT